MEIKILNCEKTALELELYGCDSAIQELITNKLSQNDAVEFVSYKIDHPLTERYKMIVKTKNKDAIDVTTAAINELRNDIIEFKKALK
ncbi:MAG: RpoL/Rpb11 RNA polymerase subunit family protein [Candidatus Micrarchaeota archaeon]